MANSDPSRTEEATPKRIEDARKKGQLLIHEDICSLAVIIGAGLLTIPTAHLATTTVGGLLQHLLRDIDPRDTWSDGMVVGILARCALDLGVMAAPLALGTFVIGVLSNRAQIGNYLEVGMLKLKWDQLDPVQGMKRVLPTTENMVKLLLTLSKVLVIAGIVWLGIRRDLDTIVWLPAQGFFYASAWMLRRVLALAALTIMPLVAIVVAGYVFRRKKYFEDLMMTKSEVKDERRNMDGDQQVKGRIRRRMREFSLMRLVAEVPQADVVVTNPTHVAVALRYRAAEGAPVVVAKGLRKRALRIRQLAGQAGVPIIEAPPVARALYRTTAVGALIPPHLYAAVAAILARVYKFRAPALQR